MSLPSTVIYYTGYERLRDVFAEQFRIYEGQHYAPLVAGMVARTIAATVISPMELVRTRLQAVGGVVDKGLRGVMRGVAEMTRTAGMSSLWRGVGSTLWRDVPFSGIYWAGYEDLKKRLDVEWTDGTAMTEFYKAFIAGASSGTIAAIATMPFDVAKTVQQVDVGQSAEARPPMVAVMRRVVRQEGWRGLFK
ncbi:hypothetical protein HDV00_005980, partial [Rhizophlyctis rosea]